MKTRWSFLGALILGVAFLAACNSGTTTYAPPSYTVIPCTLPSGTLAALAYPEPSATAVPTSPGQVVIAVSTALPNTWQVVLQFPSGYLAWQSLLNTIAPSAIPTPYAVPTFANPTYESSGLTSALPANTTINVLLNNQGSICNQFPQIGSFTTQ
jgi:hypothetical protein